MSRRRVDIKKVQYLINRERGKRNIPYVKWNQEMYHLAKSQADYCRRVKHMVHSNRYALHGGENLFYCSENTTPKTIVDTWMHSKDGHREWLLDPRVKSAGVGISNSKHGVYVAWAFSEKAIKRNKRRKSSISNIWTLTERERDILISFIVIGAIVFYLNFTFGFDLIMTIGIIVFGLILFWWMGLIRDEPMARFDHY